MSSSISTAVLGTGSIGSRHLAVLRALGERPIAVPLRASRRPELVADGYSCAESLEAARDAGATAAVIATKTGRHCADVESALNLGLDVLSEKPLATSFSEAETLPGLAASRGVDLFVAYCLRFDSGLQAFREGLLSIGNVHSVRIECRSFLPDWRLGRNYQETYSAQVGEGGVLMDLSHEIDYAVWLFGEVDQLAGETVVLGRLGIETEELGEAVWSTTSGIRVSVALDYISRCPVRFVRASGSEGELAYDFISGSLKQMSPGNNVTVQQFERRANAMYESQAKAFLHAASGEAPRVLASGAEALHVLKVSDAWRRSALSGKRERVQ